jgi:hypothetical protein
MVKVRTLPQNNYKAIFFNGKTLRIAIDPTKDIYELDYPEFYDVKITDKCFGGCSYCYQDSRKDSEHFPNIIENINKFFGSMSENNRPFQVALGGGEPTLHPQFIKILKVFKDLGIEPNYTTNGMNLTTNILNATKKYCSGVAISCHPHLESYWRTATNKLSELEIIVNLHLIISDGRSIIRFADIFDEFKNIVDYFVLLPVVNKGRCKDQEIDYSLLKMILYNIKSDGDINKIAFGAGFYEFLKENKWINASLYQPEAFSKYLDMSDMSLYNSSFE